MNFEPISARRDEPDDAAKAMLKPTSWLPKIEFIKQLILKNNVLITILGDAQSGKTSFADLLQASLPTKVKCYRITASPLMDNNTFLQHLNDLLHLNGEALMSHFITQMNEQKSHTLLMIDNASYLSRDLIEELLEGLRQQDQQGHFHVCLISNLSLEPIMNQLAGSAYPDMIHSISIGPLTESETKAYVMQHMASIPGSDELITDDRIAQFFQLTEGRIERINCQMTDFFSNKPSALLRNKGSLRQASMVASVVVAVLGMAYLWLSQTPPSLPIEQANLQVAPLETPQDPILNSYVPTYAEATTRQAVEAVALRRADWSIGEEEDVKPESQAVMDKVIVAPKVIKSQVTHHPIVKKPTVHVAAAQSAVKTIKKAQTMKTVVAHSRYTIQLLAARDKKKLQRFAATHGNQGPMQVRKMERLGTVWYVLTLGEYADHQQAKDAVTRLPKSLAQFKPWVRLVSELKAG